MKLKDIQENQLIGIRIRTNNGIVGVFHSKIVGGVLLSANHDEERLYPILSNNIDDWDVVDENTKINCDKLTSHNYTIEL